MRSGKRKEQNGCRGSMTVFFCLAMLLIGAIICTCLESARTAGLRFMAKTASDSALQSVFADYHEELWEKYHVFFHHEQGEMEAALEEYLAYYTEPAKGIYGLDGYTDLWGLSVEEVSVTEKTTALADGGRLFLAQAVEYERYQIAGDLLEMLIERVGFLDEIEKIRSFAVKISGCLEQIQKISALYQQVRDGVASVLEVGQLVLGQVDAEEFDPDVVRRGLGLLEEGLSALRELAISYLKDAAELEGLVDELAEEFGSSLDTVYGQQISQLAAFTIKGLLGKAVEAVEDRAEDLQDQVILALEEMLTLQEEEETEGEETETTAGSEAAEGDTAAGSEAAEGETVAGSENAEGDTTAGSETAEGDTTPETEAAAGSGTSEEEKSLPEKLKILVESCLQQLTVLGGGLLQAEADTSGEGEDGAGEGEDGAGDGAGVGDGEDLPDGGNGVSGEIDGLEGGEDAGESLFELVKQWKNMAVLSLAMGSDALQTRADTFGEPSQLPSKLSAGELPEVTLADKGLLIFYLDNHFTSVLSGEQGNFAYQQEYILFGKDDSRSNLTAMAESLLAIREGLNLAFLVTNTRMRTLAETAAYALVGATGMYPLVLVTEFVILAAWAFAESVYDLRELFRGEKVPVWKTEGTWHTAVNGLVRTEGGALEDQITSEILGLSYGDYLKLFLMIVDTRTLCLRSMDVIQEEICGEQPEFRMEDCYGDARATVQFFAPYRLITLPLVGVSGESGHRIEAGSSFAYR